MRTRALYHPPPLTPRFFLDGGHFALEQTRDAHQIQISYSTLADPTKVSDFIPLGANLTRTFSGSSCLPAPDFSTFGLSAGQAMTLKLEFTTGVRLSRSVWSKRQTTDVSSPFHSPGTQPTTAAPTSTSSTLRRTSSQRTSALTVSLSPEHQRLHLAEPFRSLRLSQ